MSGTVIPFLNLQLISNIFFLCYPWREHKPRLSLLLYNYCIFVLYSPTCRYVVKLTKKLDQVKNTVLATSKKHFILNSMYSICSNCTAGEISSLIALPGVGISYVPTDIRNTLPAKESFYNISSLLGENSCLFSYTYLL